MSISRRTVLLTVLAACGARSRSPHVDRTPFDAGPVADYPPFTAIRFAHAGVVVVRDDVGVMAVSSLCTHQACDLEISNDRLTCRCHASEFAMDGSLLRGPAKEPLPHYAVRVVDGRVIVDRATVVEPSTRLAI